MNQCNHILKFLVQILCDQLKNINTCCIFLAKEQSTFAKMGHRGSVSTFQIQSHYPSLSLSKKCTLSRKTVWSNTIETHSQQNGSRWKIKPCLLFWVLSGLHAFRIGSHAVNDRVESASLNQYLCSYDVCLSVQMSHHGINCQHPSSECYFLYFETTWNLSW